MKVQKIGNLLDDTENEYSNFVTKKWFVIDSESNSNYWKDEEIKFLTRSIESSLWDYSDAYILVTGDITARPNIALTQVILKIVHHLKNEEQK